MHRPPHSSLRSPPCKSTPRLAAFATPVAAAAPAAPAAAVVLDERFGCGWFDSSRELTEGLSVVEDFDPIVFELWASALSMPVV